MEGKAFNLRISITTRATSVVERRKEGIIGKSITT